MLRQISLRYASDPNQDNSQEMLIIITNKKVNAYISIYVEVLNLMSHIFSTKFPVIKNMVLKALEGRLLKYAVTLDASQKLSE